jgi:hypothetical protein
MTLDEWNDLTNSLRTELASARAEAMRLAVVLGEAHVFIHRVAWGTGQPGDRPLAGGVALEARALLERQQAEVWPAQQDSESAA